MSTKNLSELATRAQAGHMFDSVEGQFMSLPRDAMQRIVVTPGSVELYKAGHQTLVEELLAKFGFPPYPAIGEVIELTLDGNAPENQPLAMVSAFGYDPTKWRHDGPKVAGGKKTRRFKLVSVGRYPDLDAMRGKLKVHGETEGQWIVAFKAVFPQPDGKGPVGVVDSSWVNPQGGACFPYVNSDGRLRFRWVVDVQPGHWRWLVPVK